MPLISEQRTVTEQIGERVFATKVTTGASEVTIDLSTIQMPLSPAGEFVCQPSGVNQPLLHLQCDQDFYYCFGPTTVTLPAGANPGILVKVTDPPHLIRPASGPGRTVLRVLQSTTTGTMRVYVSRLAVRS